MGRGARKEFPKEGFGKILRVQPSDKQHRVALILQWIPLTSRHLKTYINMYSLLIYYYLNVFRWNVLSGKLKVIIYIFTSLKSLC